QVETFAAVSLAVETWRWAGVPILIRAGKCMAADAIEVRVQFKAPPQELYKGLYGDSRCAPESFRFRVGPAVTVLALGEHVKRSGDAMVGRDVELLASEEQTHDVLAYERLLGDAMRGDPSLFARQDTV